MRFGSHISIRDGYLGAAYHAVKIGAKSFQYFPKNPRSLSVKEFDCHDAKECAKFCNDHDLLTIAHTPYPTNLVADEDQIKLVIDSLLNDLEIANECGSIGVVVHFGVLKNTTNPLEGYQRMIGTLNEVLARWDGEALILLENNAGKSGPTGTMIEELVQVRQLTEYPDKIGFCLDTCHLFASGVWDGDNWHEVEEKGIELGLFEHLKAVHLNNSAYPTRSMKDRHANIPSGEIKVEQIIEFLLSPVFRDIPFVLETPHERKFSHEDEIKFLNEMMGQFANGHKP
ncbi:deoxyribonuclease IV [Bacillus sp. REN16]|uniref:deoxyribonuclease IV n=1 Tax=Bacillus sp. REN16 TaxID=2887296 RepID=UPI001E6146A2|nr:deoxyribonuclease IV [Bacillus sp. REN16]MCC3357215.1 deoxyribonuclease IV [Bacillus sp. REN16]